MPRPAITPKNLDLIDFICENKILKTEQIHTFFFKSGTQKNTANVLRRLFQRGLVSRDWLPLPAHAENRRAHPAAVFYVSKQNLVALRKALEAEHRADDWTRFDDHYYDAKKVTRFAHNTLHHEIGITRTKLALETGLEENRDISLPFFLRTSPSHPDVSQSVTATLHKKDSGKEYKKKLPFNPDGVFALTNDGVISFYFLEFDNHTETTKEKLTNKFIAYYAYFKQNHFAETTLPTLNARYGLGLPEIKKSIFRVLFVTTNQTRCNDLFIKSTVLTTSTLFNFTTIDALDADPYGAIWINKKAFAPHNREYQQLVKNARPSVARKFRDDAIEVMEKTVIP